MAQPEAGEADNGVHAMDQTEETDNGAHAMDQNDAAADEADFVAFDSGWYLMDVLMQASLFFLICFCCCMSHARTAI